MDHERRNVTSSIEREPSGSGLWGWFYASLWLNAVLLAGLALFPHLGREAAWRHWLAWAVGLGITARMVREQRILIHDFLTTFSHRERLCLGVLAGVLFLMPVLFEGRRVIPDGFLWTTPLLILLAVTPSLARRLLTLTVAGAWCAAYWARGPLELGLLAGFAVSWLLALGMAHVTFVTDAHDFGGLWPAARLTRSVAAAALPSGVAGVVAWLIWPAEGLVRWPVEDRRYAPPPPPSGAASWERITQSAWIAANLLLLMTLLCLMAYFLRRWMLRRSGANGDAGLPPGSSARLEYAAEPPPPVRPALTGARGRIVRLWGRWEAALEREGLGRQPGETADEFVQRLAAEQPDAAPAGALAELLDRAHYSQTGMDQTDVERMRDLVRDELSRQSLRLGAPMENTED